jgi:hypothetical protein
MNMILNNDCDDHVCLHVLVGGLFFFFFFGLLLLLLFFMYLFIVFHSIDMHCNGRFLSIALPL